MQKNTKEEKTEKPFRWCCAKCRRNLPLSKFAKDSPRPHGIQNVCRECLKKKRIEAAGGKKSQQAEDLDIAEADAKEWNEKHPLDIEKTRSFLCLLLELIRSGRKINTTFEDFLPQTNKGRLK